MACKTCKKEKKIVNKKDKTLVKNNLFTKFRDYTIKTFVFLFLSAIFVPLIIPITLYVLFITVFTEKGLNIVPLMLFIGKKLFKKDEEDDDDDDDLSYEFNEDNFELDESVITVVKTK